MTSKGIPESQPDVESFLNLSFCDYEDQLIRRQRSLPKGLVTAG
jgi:hypothetical protein